jgi:N-acetylglucosamine repressor
MAFAYSTDQTGHNLKDVKLANRTVVFRTIREASLISRAELAKHTGLNPATLTHITRELLEQGLIEEAGFGESRGGRRRSMLRICSQKGYIIAIRLSRANIQGILTDIDMHEIFRQTVHASLSNPFDINLPALLGLINKLIEQSGIERKKILGVGICAPGPLDARKGILIAPPNFPGWPNTSLCQIVERETGFPTFLDNDANAAALAEKWFGAARDMDNFAYLLIEDGVGGGLVVNGDIYRGNHDVAGEIGHMTIQADGPQCSCGNSGCLEIYASPRTAEEYVARSIAAGRASTIVDLTSGAEEANFEIIAKAAHAGDSLALEALQPIVRALVIGITNMINLFDPETVIIGGKISLVGDLIQNELQDQVNRRVLPRGGQVIPILFSGLNADSPVIGAFSLVLRELFQNPEFHLKLTR